MIRPLCILAALTLTAGCASAPHDAAKADQPTPITPTERYKMEAEQVPDTIALAQHADGLSVRQRDALADYARGYIEAGGEQVVIRAPQSGGDQALAMARAAEAALEASGLKQAEVRLDVDSTAAANAPITLVYQRWRAKPIACGRTWESLGNSMDNEAKVNFGCAETANMAAQIADPRDLLGQRASDPADAARRSDVLDKYRKGEITASKYDEKMKAVLSDAVQ